jgi:hypothetical protein
MWCSVLHGMRSWWIGLIIKSVMDSLAMGLQMSRVMCAPSTLNYAKVGGYEIITTNKPMMMRAEHVREQVMCTMNSICRQSQTRKRRNSCTWILKDSPLQNYRPPFEGARTFINVLGS